MDNLPPTQVEARLAHIRRQRANLEQLVELDREEERLMALRDGARKGHLPTPANLMQSTEMPTPTAGRAEDAVDLTTPPPLTQRVKREPKQERIDSPVPSAFEGEPNRQHTPPLHSDHLVDQPQAYRTRRQGVAVESVFDSPPPNNVFAPQQETSIRIRTAKKKNNPCDPRFAPVVDDAEYRTIIKAPNGEGQDLVEMSCKFCEANCGVTSGTKLFFKGDNGWRGHISNCHKRDLPSGSKLSATYLMANCITFRKLTPQETEAVPSHKHAEFVVVLKSGPGAQPSTAAKKRKRKRAAADVVVDQEDEAEREILEAIEDPHKHAYGSINAKNHSNSSTEEAEEEFADIDYASEDHPFRMFTRKGGRRTRRTPDLVVRKVE